MILLLPTNSTCWVSTCFGNTHSYYIQTACTFNIVHDKNILLLLSAVVRSVCVCVYAFILCFYTIFCICVYIHTYICTLYFLFITYVSSVFSQSLWNLFSLRSLGFMQDRKKPYLSSVKKLLNKKNIN